MSRPSPRLVGRIGVLVFAAIAAALAVHAVTSFPFRWIDLRVYEWGGEAAPAPGDLYVAREPRLGMPFTYTPFAALLFRMLDGAGLLTPLLWTAASLAALARTSMLLARENLDSTWRIGTSWVALACAAAFVATQPGSSCLRLGQIGFLLLWLVVEAGYTPHERTAGVLVALAAAIKLTPAVFILLFAAVGRWRAAATAVAAGIVTIIIGALFLPRESATYWRHLGPDVRTIGSATAPDNWSLNGSVHRAVAGGFAPVWLPLAIVALFVCLRLATVWWNAGNIAVAIGLTGLGAALASPFTWSHHWVLVLPLFPGLFSVILGAEHRRRSALSALAGSYVLVLTGVWWHLPRAVFAPLPSGITNAIATNSYLIAAALLLFLSWRLSPRRDLSETRGSGRHTCRESIST